MRRSLLFVPGNHPGMLLNADVYGADALIFDLEDAVAPSEKDAARILVRSALQSSGYSGAEIIIRINPLDSEFIQEDIKVMAALKPDFIMPTKVANADDIVKIADMITQAEIENGIVPGSVKLLPLLETAMGIENAYEVARASERVKAIFLGAEDLSSDLQALRSKSNEEILYARGRVVMAARAAGIDAYDTPFTDVNDDEGLARDAQYARAIGFTGKAAISPRHVPAINEAFSPTQKEISYAREVMEAIKEAQRLGKGAISLHGKMVDKPIVDRARRVLDTARALGLGGVDDE
ncbi:MAG: HpcH/HpaI aldolase/citrate lyase family protein [Clostridiales bacterium]|nr:HpcH/HpaI aldolase/citrate lyase family protein [Clostridiales bacterium]